MATYDTPAPRTPGLPRVRRRLALWLMVLAAVAGWAAVQPEPPAEPYPWTGTLDI